MRRSMHRRAGSYSRRHVQASRRAGGRGAGRAGCMWRALKLEGRWPGVHTGRQHVRVGGEETAGPRGVDG